ncbi:MAG: STAS domain-containing protein [bacterium]|nr:STAS domain-containing protein [bacterium]
MKEALKIRIEKSETKPPVAVFYLQGYLQANTLEQFTQTIDSVLDEGIYHLIFFCNDIAFASSAAFGELLNILDKVEQHDGRLVMCCLSLPVAEVFDLLDFYDIFVVTNTIEEALQKITEKREGSGNQ